MLWTAFALPMMLEWGRYIGYGGGRFEYMTDPRGGVGIGLGLYFW